MQIRSPWGTVLLATRQIAGQWRGAQTRLHSPPLKVDLPPRGAAQGGPNMGVEEQAIDSSDGGGECERSQTDSHHTARDSENRLAAND